MITMSPKFKYKDILKVNLKCSTHHDKIGVVTERFQLRTIGMPIYYVMVFSDQTTGTINEEHLEKFAGILLKPIIANDYKTL